jgi:hypothetical protein
MDTLYDVGNYFPTWWKGREGRLPETAIDLQIHIDALSAIPPAPRSDQDLK